MNRTLTLKATRITETTVTANTMRTLKLLTAVQVGRTLARKWDMLAVIGLVVSSAVYGVYALTQMTGF